MRTVIGICIICGLLSGFLGMTIDVIKLKAKKNSGVDHAVAAKAVPECGKLCDGSFWTNDEYTVLAEIQIELDAGKDVMARDEYAITPLHAAARRGTPRHIQALLDAGADVMARDTNGDTPLHDAAGWGSAENVEALMNAGAEAKARNKRGETPWDYAQENRKLRDTTAYRALNEARLK